MTLIGEPLAVPIVGHCPYLDGGVGIEVASVINLSQASGRVAAGLFMNLFYQIHPPTIDTLVT